MPRPPKLTDDEVRARLDDLPGWEIVDGKLHRELRFADFTEAFSFMVRVAFVAESLDHHPDWTNVWNRLVIDLHTHEAGGLTELDVQMAARISDLVGG